MSPPVRPQQFPDKIRVGTTTTSDALLVQNVHQTASRFDTTQGPEHCLVVGVAVHGTRRPTAPVALLPIRRPRIVVATARWRS